MSERGLIGPRRTGMPSPSRLLRALAVAMVVPLLGGCTLTDLLPADDSGAGDSGSGPATDAPPPAAGDLLQVDAIDVLILESFPVQINVVVRGTVPDACTAVGEITQERTDAAIEVTIATNRDPDAFCAQVLTPVEETIALAGDFPSGEYTVSVNGVTETFRV